MAGSKRGPLKQDDGQYRRHEGTRPRRRLPFAQQTAQVALGCLVLIGGGGFLTTAARALTLTDAVGHSVTVATPVKAIVPAGPPAQVLLSALAPDRLAGLVEPFKPDHAIYADERIVHAPQIPLLARTTAPGDIAMVADLKPNLIVDYGSMTPRYAATDAKIEKTLGVPTVLFGGSLTDAPKVLRTLGAAIDAEARAATLAGKVEQILDKAKPLADLPEADRPRVYLARGADGLSAARSGTSFDEPLRLAGAQNVVEAGNGTFRKMTIEEVVALAPAVVIFADREALSSPLHAALPKGTRFVLDKGEPYKVLTGPPSLNRLVGLAALAELLHPSAFAMEADDVARVETTLFPIPPGLAVPAPLEEIKP
jgi:iron complex transport system substrate-binding protein